MNEYIILITLSFGILGCGYSDNRLSYTYQETNYEDSCESIPIDSVITESIRVLPSSVHSNESWLLCERMVNGDEYAFLEFQAKKSNIPEVNDCREKTAQCRMKMIKTSRKRFKRPQNEWGKRITDTFGLHPNEVILFEKGIALYRKKRYSFFHKATLERAPDLNEKIEIRQGIDGYWYPVIFRDEKFIPLTYWGKIPD